MPEDPEDGSNSAAHGYPWFRMKGAEAGFPRAGISRSEDEKDRAMWTGVVICCNRARSDACPGADTLSDSLGTVFMRGAFFTSGSGKGSHDIRIGAMSHGRLRRRVSGVRSPETGSAGGRR